MEDKKIIGYKSEIDLYGGAIPAGTMYVFPDKYGNESQWYTPIHKRGCEAGAYAIPKEIVEAWEPVYEDNFKIVKMRASNGDFELKITSDGIYYEAENTKLSISWIKTIISYNNSFGCTVKEDEKTYKLEITKINVGCKNDTFIEDWKNAYNVYMGLSEKITR